MCFSLAYELAGDMEDLLTNLRLIPERMGANLDITGGMITAEKMMMLLAPIIGRQEAHDVVHHAVGQAADTGDSLCTVLLREEAICKAVSSTQLKKAFDPANYTGHCVSMAHDAALRARKASIRLQK